METKELVCVNCPMGCRITVTLDNGKLMDIKGYTCERGKNYAAQECIRPMRILTSTVRIENAGFRVLPVITSKEIPLDMMKQAMEQIRSMSVQAPVKVSQVLVHDFLHTGADLIASRSMDRI